MEKVTEKWLEAQLRRGVEGLGGVYLKFTVPNVNGVPDRLILFPVGLVYFAEIKTPGEKLRPLQEKRKNQLEGMGFKVYIVKSLKDVENFIKEIKHAKEV